VDPVEPVAKAAKQMEDLGVRYKVLIAHASLEESAQVAKAVPKFDLVITSGGFGEPTYKPEAIEGTPSQMVQVGVKGMYAGLIGLYDDPNQPVRYQRIALTDQFPDSQRMTELFQRYQEELQLTGLEGLGLRPLMHSSNRRFVGSEKCGECHTQAFEIWKGTPHSHATDSIVHPPERSEIARHFDPECLSCHVTGWNPQKYYPYTSGFLGLEASRHLVGNGCENCHGPGAEHSAAEEGSSSADPTMLTRLREEMKLPLDR
ncbi:MAG: multiheme c-type cytochrome, partial [Pirellulaceae bacterium]